MPGGPVSRRTENLSVKCKRCTFQGASFEIADIDHITPANDKCNISNSDPQPSERLSTANLISAVGYAWGCASKPLSLLLPKSNAKSKSEVIEEGGILHYSTDEGTSCTSTSAGDKSDSFFYFSSKEKYKASVEENQEYSKHSYEKFSFWRTVLDRHTLLEGASLNDCLPSAEIPSNFGSTYNWMTKMAYYKPKNLVNSVEFESKMATDFSNDCCLENSVRGCEIGNECCSHQSLTAGVSASKPEVLGPLDLSSNNSAKFDLKPSTATCLGEKDAMLPPEATYCKVSTLQCATDSDDAKLETHSYDCKNSLNENRKGTYENQEDREETLVKADISESDISLLGKRKPQYALAKQEHAFAGAMAGIFVSLCLHPVDTVKTVIQSCHTSDKTVLYISRSIIAERGILGLYRGIYSNIVTSAPISALYTFTYESVKKSLLPLLPKEYHSLAHCTAGGCASIATSFIFTPSEHIKQQMQVSSHYRNCWTALIQVLQNGGLPSLYAGWGAVLCRNVPQSVIKFYTYEKLKQIMLPSIQQNARANMLMTLVCGGLAGSTASLFTTPFDVVKTRLQTQVPGSLTKHSGVLSTLNEIWKHEGLNGVYSGLTPRLVMYMIQGALFFASYESFKSLLSIDFPRLSSRTFQHEQTKEDDSNILSSAVPPATA